MEGRKLLAEDSCLVVLTADELLIRKGLSCSDATIAGAEKHLEHLMRFENAPEAEVVDASNQRLKAALETAGLLSQC